MSLAQALGGRAHKEALTHRELLLAFLLYATFAFINLRVKLVLTPEWFNGLLERNHAQLLRFEYTNNEQSRILQFLVPELLRRTLFTTIPNAYQIQRFVFIFLSYCALHVYVRRWFDRASATLSVAVLAALTPLAYINDLQESAPLLALVYVCALWAIREQRHVAYSLILLLGALTNETSLSLGAVHFFYGARRLPRQAGDLRRIALAALRAIACAIPAIAYTLAIRYITRHNPHLGGAWHWPDNVHGMWNTLFKNPLIWYRKMYIYPWFIFGPLWVYAYLDWRSKPLFLRCASLMVPFFVGAHMLTGIIYEVRQMLPLASILIPMGMMSMFGVPEDSDDAAPERAQAEALRGDTRS